MTRCLLTICVFSLTLGRLFSQDSGKLNSRFRKTIASYNTFLYLCTSNRKKASLVPDVGLHRRQTLVLIDDRRRSSMTTKIRARNGASGELKYQPSKHTQSMINYSITMRSVNSNLLEINQAKSRIKQARMPTSSPLRTSPT